MVCRSACHCSSPKLLEITDGTCRLLVRMSSTGAALVLASVTDRGDVESVSSSVRCRDHLIVVLCYRMLERMLAGIADVFGAEVALLSRSDARLFARDHIARRQDGVSFGIPAMVHCETSMGLLNDIACRQETALLHEGLSLIDLASSLGELELDVDRPRLDRCAASGQEPVGAVGDVAFVTINAEALEVIRSDHPCCAARIRTSYAGGIRRRCASTAACGAPGAAASPGQCRRIRSSRGEGHVATWWLRQRLHTSNVTSAPAARVERDRSYSRVPVSPRAERAFGGHGRSGSSAAASCRVRRAAAEGARDPQRSMDGRFQRRDRAYQPHRGQRRGGSVAAALGAIPHEVSLPRGDDGVSGWRDALMRDWVPSS